MPTSIRKKLLLFPPMQTFPTNVVSIANGGITSSSFAPGAIDAAAIAANAIGNSEIANGAISAGKFAAGAIDAAAIAADAIGNSEIANGAISAAKFAAGAIDAAAIAADAIGASEFAQGAADKVWSTAARALTDKTGFSLTAGSYSIRASSTQASSGVISGTNTVANITVSSVTQTRAQLIWTGFMMSTATTTAGSDTQAYCGLTSPTNVETARGPSTNLGAGQLTSVFNLMEFF